jgi:2-dehydropantoate 2-reductase
MRYIVYGAGGIGSIMGGHLARTGHDVILIGRPGHVNVINNQGLHLITPTGTYVLQLIAVTDPDMVDFTPSDVVFLCMKGQDTEQALQVLKNVVEDVPVFCFQNGVRNEEITSAYFTNVYGVMVRVGAVYLKDGEVTARRAPPGWYIMGRYPEGTDEVVQTVAEELRDAGYFVRITSDIMPYKWGKLMANLGNSVDAITDSDWESTRSIRLGVFEEARAIVEKADVKWISQEQVSKEWPEISKPLLGQIDPGARSSTWQSLTRRQGNVETDFLNGEIVRLAASLGIQAPLNEKLTSITREMAAHHELPGKYTPDQLSEILKLARKD